MRTRLMLLPVLIAFGCSQSDAPPVADAEKAAGPVEDVATVRAAIEAANAKLKTAMLAGDAAAMASMYTPDAFIMANSSPGMNGMPAIQQGFVDWLGSTNITDFNLMITDVTLGGDLAVETGTFKWSMVPKAGGAAVDEQGKYVVVWKKQPDGSWKLFRDIWNADAPAK